MKLDSGRTQSVWAATSDTGVQPQLKEDVDCDVCIVGAGIAGITTAYLLSREGKRVVVLDDGPVGGGNTGRTSAHLTFYNDDGLTKIEQLHGLEGLKTATASHSAAVDRIHEIASAEKIDCDFHRVNAYLWVSPNGQGPDFLEKELDAAHRIGLKDAHWVDRAPIPFDTGKCLCYPRQAQFHPLKYLAGVTAAFWKRGGLVYGNTHASSIVGKAGGGRARVETAGGKAVTADAVVVATSSPVNDRITMHTKQTAWRTYILGLRIPKGSVPRGLYWDTEDPYHYVRWQDAGDHDVLIAGGEDHKTGQANDPDVRWANLERWTRQHFPMTGEIAFHWSGQYIEPIDCLAYSGRNPGDADNVFIHTGDSGMGLTHGTLGAILLTDLIVGRPNPWEKLYDPSRVNKRALDTYAKDQVDVMAQYRDLLTPGDVSSPDEIAPRQGAVMRRGLTKVAVYKDENEQLHTCSAICPHAAGVVRWNYAEGSWDCPCHGSRFDPYGRVIDGPANGDLARVAEA